MGYRLLDNTNIVKMTTMTMYERFLQDIKQVLRFVQTQHYLQCEALQGVPKRRTP